MGLNNHMIFQAVNARWRSWLIIDGPNSLFFVMDAPFLRRFLFVKKLREFSQKKGSGVGNPAILGKYFKNGQDNDRPDGVVSLFSGDFAEYLWIGSRIR